MGRMHYVAQCIECGEKNTNPNPEAVECWRNNHIQETGHVVGFKGRPKIRPEEKITTIEEDNKWDISRSYI